MAGNMATLCVFLAVFLLMTFHGNSSGQDQQQQTVDVWPGDDLILQFNPIDTKDLYLVKKKQGEVQVVPLLRWRSTPKDPKIKDPALDGRVESSYDQDTNTLTVRINNFQLSDTGPGVYFEFQQSQDTSSQFHPNVIAPPTDLAVIATKLYSVEVGITGGKDGLEPQSLCLWYREQGTEEWKKGKGENSCRNGVRDSCRNCVREGEEITLQSTLPDANTTYQICVVAQNRLYSSRCEEAHSQVTTDSVASFNATIRLPGEPYKSPDRNHRENHDLVTRIIDSVNNALQPAYPDLEVEVVQFREGSVLADLKISVGLREIEDLKDDLVSVVRSGQLTGIDVDKNYLLIDNEIPLVPEDNTDNNRREFVPQGPFTLHNDSSRAYLAKPMAHLTLTPRHIPRHGRGKGMVKNLKIQSWESRIGLAMVANGMTYRDGAIWVPVDGLYYVYSQLYFRHLCPTAADGSSAEDRSGENVQLHCTFKKSTTYWVKQEIMKSARTRCSSKDISYELLPSYQGGVFRLRAGDKLFVQASPLDMVSFEEAASYFGAFMI